MEIFPTIFSTGRQPIVNRVVARKATDLSKFCKRCETGDSIGLNSVSECTRKLLMMTLKTSNYGQILIIIIHTKGSILVDKSFSVGTTR